MSRIIFGAFSSAILLAAPFLAPILFPLAWVAFVPLLWAVDRAKNLRAAVFYGWLTGFIAHLVGFHWLVYTINVFGGFPYSISTVVFLIYAALQGLEIAIFAFLVRGIGFGPWLIFPALFWVSYRILVSAPISVALGEQPEFFFLVHSDSRPRGVIRREFPSHVVQRDCCWGAIQKRARC